jgi:hypothetical protein
MVLDKKEFNRMETEHKKYLDISNGFAMFLLFFFNSLLFGRLRE